MAEPNKTLLDKINQGRQYRSMKMEIEERKSEQDGYIVKGYATTFNEPYTLYDSDDFEIREQVAPDSFKNCEMDDVIFQYDHEGRVFARISNGTLTLKTDEHGLYITADLGGTEEGRKLYEEIKGGYTNKMSFGFIVAEDEELRTSENGKDVYIRTIKAFKRLFDVSAVSIPANSGTEISARKLVDGLIQRRAQELSEEEQKKAEEEKRRAEEEKQLKEKEERERLALELEFSLSFNK